MRFYVASKFERKEEVKAIMRSLRLAGHTIVGDWTSHSTDGEDPGDVVALLRAFAREDRDSVVAADAVVLLHDERCKGGFTELGVALGARERIGILDRPHVYVVGGAGAAPYKGPIFYALPEVLHFDAVGDLLDYLDKTRSEN